MATSSQRAVGLRKGFRSGLEDAIAQQLNSAGCDYEYEGTKISYVHPQTKHTYTPDFVLPNGIIIESKGHFTPDDRKKHIWIKEQHPELDIRFVFQRSKTKLRKGAKTTYADWCRKHGFLFADKYIPQEWIEEQPASGEANQD